MGGPYAFDPSDTGAHYHSFQTRGGGPIDGTFHYTEHENIFGATVDDGKAEAFRKVQAGLNPESLQTKAEAWQLVHDHIKGIGGRLSTAYTQVFNAWSGDDADAAQKTFGHVLTSTSALTDNANSMYTGTKQVADAAQKAKGVSSDGPGFGSKLSGGLGLGGGDGDGNADVQAYFQLVDSVVTGRDYMPQTVQWQVKTDGGGPDIRGGDPGAAGGGGGVGGVSSPHMGGSSPHSSVATPNIKNPGSVPHHTNTGIPPVGPTDPTGTTTIGDPTGGTPGGGTPGGGSTVGIPHIDTGSSLAGMDGSGAGFGGGGSGAYGGGGLGSMSAGLGGGVGGGGIGGGVGATSGLAGEGLGAAGAGAGMGAGGAGAAGAGAAGAGAGRAGAGGMMMPMRGGAGGNDEDERERSTWLEEDDDVWGEADAPPSVIR